MFSSLASLDFIQIVRHNFVLIYELTKRNFRDRYTGQVFGRVWMFLHPALIISIYIFLFGAVFKARVAVSSHSGISNFSVYILSGLIPWLCLLETLGRAATVITSQASLVKQVVFPIEVLPLVNVCAALVTQAVMLVLFLVFALFVYGGPLATWALILPLLILQFLMLAGLSYGVSAMGVYLRDLKDLVQVFSTIGLYVAPIVYDPSWVPEPLRPLLYANPFSYMAWCFQDVFYFGRIDHPASWGLFAVFSCLVFVCGFGLFRRVRPYFGSAL